MLPHKASHKGFKPRTERMSRGTAQLRRTRRLVSDWRVKHEQGTRRRLVEDLDEVTSLIVRLRDGYRCVMCGSSYEPQAAHLWKRGIYATRWDLDNVWTNCPKHNIDHNVRPEPFMNWVAAKIGEERYDALRARKDSKRKMPDAELESLLDSHRALLRTMKRAA